MTSLELEIAEWRSYVAKGPAVDGRDVEELEAHLRDQIADLNAAGLAPDEAFLIAVKRMGSVDDLSREFAREHSGRLWRQLIVSGDANKESAATGWAGALLFALAAATTLSVALVLAGWPDDVAPWLGRNTALLALPFLAAWFAYRRRVTPRQWGISAAAVAAVAAVVNGYPYGSDSVTVVLAATHLPVALWFVVAYPYMGAAVRSHERRMDFVRFTGEWCIYYVLIGLGGAVLLGLTAAILQPTGIDPEWVIEWVLPVGAVGAVIVAAWIVESKQQVIENMAPVLTMLFTPLFALMLIVAAFAYAATGLGDTFDRELVAVFDVLMVVVLGLVLYGISARGPEQGPGWMDRLQLVAVAGALLLDVMVLVSMAARIGDLGLTPNRVAALGLNLVLLVNLAGAAWLATRYLTGRGTFHRLERWETAYLPVFGVWAVVVVAVLPPAFAFA